MLNCVRLYAFVRYMVEKAGFQIGHVRGIICEGNASTAGQQTAFLPGLEMEGGPGAAPAKGKHPLRASRRLPDPC